MHIVGSTSVVTPPLEEMHRAGVVVEVPHPSAALSTHGTEHADQVVLATQKRSGHAGAVHWFTVAGGGLLGLVHCASSTRACRPVEVDVATHMAFRRTNPTEVWLAVEHVAEQLDHDENCNETRHGSKDLVITANKTTSSNPRASLHKAGGLMLHTSITGMLRVQALGKCEGGGPHLPREHKL